jgi:hypothetical protein
MQLGAPTHAGRSLSRSNTLTLIARVLLLLLLLLLHSSTCLQGPLLTS